MPEQLVPTVAASWDGDADVPFGLVAATLNAQGLAGKYQYYEEQLRALECNLLFVQETKAPASFCLSRSFLRMSTDAQKHWGVGIWISRTLGLLTLQGKPRLVQEADTPPRGHDQCWRHDYRSGLHTLPAPGQDG